MPVWGFAKKSVKVFLNFTFGQFFCQPLEDAQIFVAPGGIGCKDLYFNTEKINAVLAERGIPLVVCVAYVSELVVCLPSSVEIKGVDLVVQARGGECSPMQDAALFNSMFSSMTAAAFAAAKVASDTNEWLNTGDDQLVENEESDEDNPSDSESVNSSQAGFGVWRTIQRLFERITTTAEKVDLNNTNQQFFVDRESKERVAFMIDSRLNRASGICINLDCLSIENQATSTGCESDTSRLGADSQTGIGDHSGSGQTDGWSWLWNWGRSNTSGAPSLTQRPSTAGSSVRGSLSTMLHKNIALTGFELFWDLWNTSKQRRRPESMSMPDGEEDAFSSAAQSDSAAVYPTRDNLLASAKLLTLAGSHTARVSVRCPLFSCTQTSGETTPSKSSTDAIAAAAASSEYNSTGRSSLWDLFELRVHLDLGPIVACACPSQFYWLQLLVGQLSSIYERYSTVNRRKSSMNPNEVCAADMRSNGGCPSDPTVYSRDAGRVSHLIRPTGFPLDHPNIDPNYMGESELVDLDLSTKNCSPTNVTRPLVDSKLFWSCVTNESDPVMSDFIDSDQPHRGHTDQSEAGPSDTSTEPKFSMSANMLCVALVAFYEDEATYAATKETENTLESQSKTTGSGRSTKRLRRTSVRTSSSGDTASDCASRTSETSSDPDTRNEQTPPRTVDEQKSDIDPESMQNLASLPGPQAFFTRFDGILPPGHQKPATVTEQSHQQKPDDSDQLYGAPLRIDRSEVDTGQLSPSAWVAKLRRQFAELAAPRDHICFIGGLWHVELFSLSRGSDTQDVCGRNTTNVGSTQCSAQLFGIEMSECLFPDSWHSSDPVQMLKPQIVEFVSFPDRPRNTLDRTSSSGNMAAVQLEGVIQSRPTTTWSSREPRLGASFSKNVRLNLAHCRLDIDISLADRLHRIQDAMVAASEAVARFLPMNMSSSTDLSQQQRHYDWWQSELPARTEEVGWARGGHGFVPNTTRHQFQPLSSARRPLMEINEDTDSLDLQLTCSGVEVLLRFPVPLEAVHPEMAQTPSDLRNKLWTTGVPLWFDEDKSTGGCDDENSTTIRDSVYSTRDSGLAWWRQTLRSEYLRINMSKLLISFRSIEDDPNTLSPVSDATVHGGSGGAHARVFGELGEQSQGIRGEHVAGQADRAMVIGEPEVRISARSLSVHVVDNRSKIQSSPLLQFVPSNSSSTVSSIICTIHLAPLGRQELLERSTDDRDKFSDNADSVEPNQTPSRRGRKHQGHFRDKVSFEQPVYTIAQHDHFEMGVDLASDPAATGQGRQNRAVEWSLWKRAGPQYNPRTPFIIRRNFLQDAPKAHSKQTTYYPGDAQHLAFYRQSASAHTHVFVRLKIATAAIRVEHKHTVEVIYLRLMYDLLLWTSLLPKDRRLRATLSRAQSTSSQTQQTGVSGARQSDHRYWFLSDPAPLASIYAHPEATREAAALEAISGGVYTGCSSGNPGVSGLHFLPVYSDDEDGLGDGEQLSSEDELNHFDAGLDSLRQRMTNMEKDQISIRQRTRQGGHGKHRAKFSPRRTDRDRPRRAHRLDSGDGDEEDEDDAKNTTATTTVQKQSFACFQLELDSIELRVNQASSSVPASYSFQNPFKDTVLVNASGFKLFAEIGHDGLVNMNYATLELHKLEVYSSSNQTGLVPGLVHWPRQGSNRSATSPSGTDGSEAGYPRNPMMITVALEHRQITRTNPHSAQSPIYRDEFNCSLRFQDACLVHWPGISSVTTVDTALPIWMLRLMDVFETPSTNLIQQLLPGYLLPETLMIQHLHLKHVAFTWSAPEPEGTPTTVPGQNPLLTHLRSVRGLVRFGSVSVTVNTASDTCPVPNGSEVPNGKGASNPPPGMLIMAFLTGTEFYLCPIASTNKTRSAPGVINMSLESSPTGFLTWLHSLNLSDCVCVADLDHLELRCFSSPMRYEQTNGSTSFINRIDVRSTNNLLRLNTCADSLVALQNLVEAFTATSSPPIVVPASQSNIPLQRMSSAPPVSTDTPVSQSPDPTVRRLGPKKPTIHGLSQRNNSRTSSLDKTPGGNCSTSSVEDLLQVAISDIDSPQSSPCRPKRPLASPLKLDVNSRPDHNLSATLEKHLSPEPRPCRTPHSNRYRQDSEPGVKMSRSPPHGNKSRSKPAHTNPGTQWQPIPTTSDGGNSSASSSPSDFVLVKPSMVPPKLPIALESKVSFKCLINPPTGLVKHTPMVQQSPEFPNALVEAPSLCEIRENHYHLPSSASVMSGTKSRMHRLFIDPPSVYPRANLAITLYNFSMQWNLYGGQDLLPAQTSNSPRPATDQPATDGDKSQPGKLGGGHEPIRPSAKPRAGGGHRFRHDRSALGTASLHSVTTESVPLRQQRSFDHSGRPIEMEHGGSQIKNNRETNKCISIRLGKIYFRHAAFPPSAKSSFKSKLDTTNSATTTAQPVTLMVGDPASRHVLTVGSLVIVDQVVSSKINQLLYTYQRAVTGSPNIPHSIDTPTFGLAVVCWRAAGAGASRGREPLLPSAVTCASPSRIPVSQSSDSTATNTGFDEHIVEDSEVSASDTASGIVDAIQRPGLELEAKISCQPLRINLDQNTLVFLEEFQQLFTTCALLAESLHSAQPPMESGLHASVHSDSSSPTQRSTRSPTPVMNTASSTEDSRSVPRPSTAVNEPVRIVGTASEGASVDLIPDLDIVPDIFIRKVTFSPDLPIRFDYHGRHLDLKGGSLQGFILMLLQLHNAELVIPRRVYQRGYPNLDRLLEEMIVDVRATLMTQWPQLLATSIGPMHEVTQFVLGLWDLIYQPVHSLYQGSRTVTGSAVGVGDIQRAYWHAPDLDLSTYDPNMASAQRAVLGGGAGGGAGGFIHGLRSGTRSFSHSTLWATLQLSIQSVRAVQLVAETTYDLVTPGPALRSRQLRLRQPANLREGFSNAMDAMNRGIQMVSEDFFGATHAQSEVQVGHKGPVGVIGDVLRQIPPTIVTPLVAGCEVTANILGGFRNQLRPEAKLEDEQKWKDTHGL